MGRILGNDARFGFRPAAPEAVTELLLSSVVMTTEAEVEWTTRTMGQFFPHEWSEFLDVLPISERDGNLAQAYNRLLMDPDPAVHVPAARAWCRWEDIHVSIANGYQAWDRYEDPAFRLTFARLVTHYWANAGFLAHGELIDRASALGDMPVFLAHGRLDISAPMATPAALAAVCQNVDFFIAEREGHGGPELTAWMTEVADRLAAD